MKSPLRAAAKGAWLAILSLILLGSLIPAATDPLKQAPSLLWNAAHIPAYAAAALLTVLALGLESGYAITAGGVALSLFGLAIEIAQPLVGRSASLMDYCSNQLGIVLGLGAIVAQRMRG